MRIYAFALLTVAVSSLTVQAQDICSSGLPVADGVCSNGGEIPGIAGQDYPVYAQVPNTNFRCDNIGVPGYYADPESGCQAFYICGRQGKGTGFLCPNGTLFNQEVLVCDWWTHVDCNQAVNFYGINQQILAEMEAANERLGVNQRERERLAAAGINPSNNPFDLRNPFNRNPSNPFVGRNPYNPTGPFAPRNPLNPNRPFDSNIQNNRFPNNNFRPTPTGFDNSRFPNRNGPFNPNTNAPFNNFGPTPDPRFPNNFGPTPGPIPDSRFPNRNTPFNNFGPTPGPLDDSRFPNRNTPFNNFGPTPGPLNDQRFPNKNTPFNNFGPTPGPLDDSRFPNRNTPFGPTPGPFQTTPFPNRNGPFNNQQLQTTRNPYGPTPGPFQPNGPFNNQQLQTTRNPYGPTAGPFPNRNGPFNNQPSTLNPYGVTPQPDSRFPNPNQQFPNSFSTPSPPFGPNAQFPNSPLNQNAINATSTSGQQFGTTLSPNGPFIATPSISNDFNGSTTIRPSSESSSSTPGYNYPTPNSPFEVNRPDREYLPPF